MASPHVLQPQFHPIALRQFRLFESTDVDDTRERISRVMQPHALLPIGTAAGANGHSRMDFARVGSLGMGTIAFGSGMRVQVESVDGYYLLMFCLSGHARVNTRSYELVADQNHAVICAPGQKFDAILSPDCEQFVLRINPDVLAEHPDYAPLNWPSRLDLSRPELQPWLQQLRFMANSPALLDCAQHNPAVAVELERLLITLLACGLEHREESGIAPGRIAPAFVRQAEQFIESNAGEALRLADIALAVNLPDRTLLDGFRKFRGTSPMQYLRQIRLQRARTALCAARPGTRVADVALACGFSHLGRFARLYLETFGENPSDTLKGA
jgi:AraC-like DNA-binding protein